MQCRKRNAARTVCLIIGMYDTSTNDNLDAEYWFPCCVSLWRCIHYVFFRCRCFHSTKCPLCKHISIIIWLRITSNINNPRAEIFEIHFYVFVSYHSTKRDRIVEIYPEGKAVNSKFANIMAAGVLAIQGVKPASAMILSLVCPEQGCPLGVPFFFQQGLGLILSHINSVIHLKLWRSHYTE